MPDYTKTTWVNNSAPPINATNKNKQEDWIAKANPYYGTSAPSDTDRVWFDTTGSPPILKIYISGAWTAVGSSVAGVGSVEGVTPSAPGGTVDFVGTGGINVIGDNTAKTITFDGTGAGGGAASDASTSVKGISRLSTAPAGDPIAVGDNDTRLSVDGASGTGTLRTLGTGATQAAPGNGSRVGSVEGVTPSPGGNIDLIGTGGITITGNDGADTITFDASALETGNVQRYGAKGSTWSTTGSITTGTPTLTVASNTGMAVGDGVLIQGAGATRNTGGNGHLVAKINTIVGTTITLDRNAVATVASVTVLPDDSIAIQAATDNNSLIYFSPLPSTSNGYNLGADIVISASGKMFRGCGWSSRIKRTGLLTSAYSVASGGVARHYFEGTGPAAAAGYSNISFRDIYIDGDDAGSGLATTPAGDQDADHFCIIVRAQPAGGRNTLNAAHKSTNISIIGCTFVNHPGPAMQLANITDSTVSGNRLIKPRRGGIVLLWGCERVAVTGNIVKDTGDDGIAVNADNSITASVYTEYSHDISITGNVCSCRSNINGGSPIVVRGPRRVAISGNTTYGGVGAGISVQDSPDPGAEYRAQDITIAGNNVSYTQNPYIDPLLSTNEVGAPGIRVLSHGANEILIVNNKIRNTGGHGVYIESIDALNSINVTGNQLRDIGEVGLGTIAGTSTGVAKGIYVHQLNTATGNINSVNTSNNTIERPLKEAIVVSANTSLLTWKCADNLIVNPNLSASGTVDAISVSGNSSARPRRFYVHGNQFIDANVTPACRYFINILQGHTGRVKNNMLLNAEVTAANSINIAGGLTNVTGSGNEQ